MRLSSVMLGALVAGFGMIGATAAHTAGVHLGHAGLSLLAGSEVRTALASPGLGPAMRAEALSISYR
jgi:hypothetical protein